MRIIIINEADLKGEFDKILQGVESGLDIAANEIKNKFLEPTSTWNHKPEFMIESKPKERIISTSDVNYARINNGTDGHFIDARNKKALKFTLPFWAKTHPGTFGSGPGNLNSEIYYAQRVWNPGIEPREWDVLIENEYSSENSGGRKLAAIIQDAINKS